MNKLDIVAISESYLDSTIRDDEVEIPGYTLLTK